MAANKKTNERKLTWVNEQLAAGRTVYFATALRVTPFTPAAVAKWQARGIEPIKLGRVTGALLIVERVVDGAPVFADASYCRLSAS